MENLISVQKLCKHYRDFSLNHVDLTVKAGSVVGLVGENGAGKTTLLRAIMGLARPDGGEIALLGGSPRDAGCRAGAAAVFEDSFFFGGLTANQIERVMRGSVPGWERARYELLLEQFELPPDKPVKEFSKGMRMKLNLAAALARRPRLLVLDEPTSGLDPVARGELLDILMEFMQDERCGILISSHITSDLDQIADEIAYLHGGEMMFQRTRVELQEEMAVARCSAAQLDALPEELVIARRRGFFGDAALVREPERVRALLPGAVVEPVGLDEMMRFYSGRDEK